MAKEEVETSFKVGLLMQGATKGTILVALGWMTAGLGPLAFSATSDFMDWATDAPILYLDTRGAIGTFSAFSVRAPGHFVVLGHGTKYGPMRKDGRGVVQVADLFAEIRCQTSYKAKMPVLLVCCEVGAGDFPQKLADLLGEPVVASPDLVNLLGFTSAKGSVNVRARWYRWTPD